VAQAAATPPRSAQTIVDGAGRVGTTTGHFLIHALNDNESIVTVDLDR
jgi:hypothetical protein